MLNLKATVYKNYNGSPFEFKKEYMSIFLKPEEIIKLSSDLEFTFTDVRYGTDGNDKINAIGFGGTVYAGDGYDDITLGALGTTVYTGKGHDFVTGGSAYLKVIDESGDLDVKGASVWSEIEKTGNGSLKFQGLSAAIKIHHTGEYCGNIHYTGAAAANFITRKGKESNITFAGAGGYNQLWHETNSGDLKFDEAGAENLLER